MSNPAIEAWLADFFAPGVDHAKELLCQSLEDVQIPTPVPVVEWAQKNFFLSPETTGTKKRLKLFGYQVGILEAMVDPKIEELYIPKAARTGISQLFMVASSYVLSVLRAHVLLYQPTEEKSKEYSADIMMPAFRDSPLLAKLKRQAYSKGEKQDKELFVQLKNMARMMLSYASTDDNFRGKSTNMVGGDELDGAGWQPGGKKSQGHKVNLAKDRFKSAPGFRKGVFWTSPDKTSTSQIWPEWEKTGQEFYFVPCPHCGELQDLKWGEPENPEVRFGIKYTLDHRRRVDEVWYECEHCHKPITEDYKVEMIKPVQWGGKAVWRETNPEGSISDDIRGMHVNVLYVPTPGTSWKKLVIAWREASKDPDKMKQFINSNLGMPANAVKVGEKVNYQAYEKRRPVKYEAECPSWVRFITMHFDTQAGWKDESLNLKPRHEVMVCGWGPGFECAVLGYFILQDHKPFSPGAVAQLDEIMNRQWKKANGQSMRAIINAFDASYEQELALAYAQGPTRKDRCRALKGEAETGKDLSPIVTASYRPTEDKNKLIMVGTRRAKNFAQEMVLNTEVGPRYVHFPESMGKVIKKFYAERGRGLFNEEPTEDQNGVLKWEPKVKKHGNTGEVWDTLVGNLVAINLACLEYKQVSRIIKDMSEIEPREKITVTEDNSIMAQIYSIIQLQLASGTLPETEAAWENDTMSILPPGATRLPVQAAANDD